MIILALIAVLAIMAIMIYNGLIRKKNAIDYAFGGISVQLKNRYDLIPNLVATVKEYATHERELLEKVTQLRQKAIEGNLNNDEKIHLDNQISGAIRNIIVSVENYPNLKANENFLNLQKSLNEVEAQIAASRRTYNAAVVDFNNGIETFPGNIFAGMMGLSHKAVFEIPEAEKQNVNVKDLFKS